MSRRFRSDDTSSWNEKYGPGTAGSATLSGTYGSSNQGAYAIGACTGTSGQTTLTVPLWGSSVYYAFIHQTQGTGVGNYELNVIESITATTATLRYPLQNTYSTGAQVCLMIPYSGITVSGTLTAPAWDGSTGGIIALLDNGTTNNSGTITASGKGFRGATLASQDGSGWSYAGEGNTGGYNSLMQRTANENGGGAGADKSGRTGGGGGGGHASDGTAGTASSEANDNGYGGGSVGQADLTTVYFGGSGGCGGITDENQYAGEGSPSGGLIFIITKNLNNTGTIVASGTNGDNAGSPGTKDAGGGGGGAGGSILVKAQTIVPGTMTANGGSGGSALTNGGAGGAGSVGRIAIDYLVSYSGGTFSPAVGSSRQDTALRLGRSFSSLII